jgi:hypothetical protein
MLHEYSQGGDGGEATEHRVRYDGVDVRLYRPLYIVEPLARGNVDLSRVRRDHGTVSGWLATCLNRPAKNLIFDQDEGKLSCRPSA